MTVKAADMKGGWGKCHCLKRLTPLFAANSVITWKFSQLRLKYLKLRMFDHRYASHNHIKSFHMHDNTVVWLNIISSEWTLCQTLRGSKLLVQLTRIVYSSCFQAKIYLLPWDNHTPLPLKCPTLYSILWRFHIFIPLCEIWFQCFMISDLCVVFIAHV